MCGLAGIITPHAELMQPEKLAAMNNCLQHRGPDDASVWISDDRTTGITHNRLSIVDLSSFAKQPLHYLHYTIGFNGEIYNYTELKQTLQQYGYIFTSDSDTEIIPAAYDKWGAECLNYFDGMFAFILYDAKQQQVFIARDRFGEKPFYYHVEYLQRGKFNKIVFASEMKALWQYGIPKQLNGMMMLNYLTLGYVQNPLKKSQTFYSNILSLPPAHYLIIKPAQGKITMRRWYTPSFQQQNLSVNEATEKFRELFFTAVERRLRSDVSVGTSLSGGLDSSAVVAAIDAVKAKAFNWKNVCFTAVFSGFKNDESEYSKQVAEHFNIHQHTISPSADDLAMHLQNLLYHQEEPVASSSVFTQYMVYHLAKEKNITVLLDGQGADEILGGYKKYTHWYLQQLLNNKQWFLFSKEKKALQHNHFIEQWSVKNYIAAFAPDKTAALLQQKAIKQQEQNRYISKDFLLAHQNTDALQKPVVNKLEDLLYYNSFVFGLEELLRYADRNSMAHSREVRLPFLYHELVEFIFSLPSSFKIRDGFTKWILRQSFSEQLPANIVWRKDKVGYEPPQAQWLSAASVKDMIMDSRSKLIQQKLLNSSILHSPIASFHAHEAGNYDWRILCAANCF